MRLGFKAVGVEVLNSIYYDIVFSIPKMFFFFKLFTVLYLYAGTGRCLHPRTPTKRQFQTRE